MTPKYTITLRGHYGKANIGLDYGLHGIAEIDTYWACIDYRMYLDRGWRVLHREVAVMRQIDSMKSFATPQKASLRSEVNALLEAAELTHKLSR